MILKEDNDHLILWLKIPPHNGKIAFASLDAALGIFVQMCRLTTGSDFSANYIELQRPKPSCHSNIKIFFNCPVKYEQAENKIWFDLKRLKSSLPTANPALARVNDEVVSQYLARFERSNVTNQIRAIIIEQLPSGVPSQENIARQIHHSVRSLQRKLQAEETTFKKLLEQTRLELAKQYLSEYQRSISEITYLLGYTEHGSFTRAFKRWTGINPQQFRELQ